MFVTNDKNDKKDGKVHSAIHAVVIYFNNKNTKKVVKYVQS